MRLLVLAALTAACGNVIARQNGDASTGASDGPVIDGSVTDGGSVPDAPPDAKVCSAAIDQQLVACASPPIAQCTDAFILFNGQSAAQTFAPSNTGTVGRLRLRMSNPAANTNPVQVSLVDLQNDPMALVNANFDVEQHVLARVQTPMTVVAAWQDVVFATPAAVIANQPYAIVVRLVGTTDPGAGVHAGWNLYNDFTGAMADSYPRGRFFDCGTGCSSWIAEPTYRDAAFEVHVTPSVCR
jgi:hypothetical protein